MINLDKEIDSILGDKEMTKEDIICKIFNFSAPTYYKRRRQDNLAIKIIESFFSLQELKEYIKTEKVEKLDDFLEFKKVENTKEYQDFLDFKRYQEFKRVGNTKEYQDFLVSKKFQDFEQQI